MGALAMRAIERAGLGELARRALDGVALGDAELAVAKSADLLALAALADAVRARFRGDVVRLCEGAARPPDVLLAEPAIGDDAGPTAVEALRELALLRLATPGARGIAVHLGRLGPQLALVALTFGADTLIGVPGGLPLADAGNKRDELAGMVELAGRTPRWDGARDVQEHAQ